jgi:hypothetical protein
MWECVSRKREVGESVLIARTGLLGHVSTTSSRQTHGRSTRGAPKRAVDTSSVGTDCAQSGGGRYTFRSIGQVAWACTRSPIEADLQCYRPLKHPRFRRYPQVGETGFVDREAADTRFDRQTWTHKHVPGVPSRQIHNRRACRTRVRAAGTSSAEIGST